MRKIKDPKKLLPSFTHNISLSLVVLIGISVLVIQYYQSCSPVHDSGEIDPWSTGSQKESIRIFKNTLYPVISTNCSACHGVSQNPRFAVSDPVISHNTILRSQLVLLSLPEDSLLVQKVQSGHNGFPASLATELLDSITEWSLQLHITEPNDDLVATFSSINAKILTPLCLHCHSPGGQKANIDFSSYQSLMSSGTVMPNQPSSSSLYTRCAPDLPAGVLAMPPNGDSLSTSQLAVLYQWISDGAQNN